MQDKVQELSQKQVHTRDSIYYRINTVLRFYTKLNDGLNIADNLNPVLCKNELNQILVAAFVPFQVIIRIAALQGPLSVRLVKVCATFRRLKCIVGLRFTYLVISSDDLEVTIGNGEYFDRLPWVLEVVQKVCFVDCVDRGTGVE